MQGTGRRDHRVRQRAWQIRCARPEVGSVQPSRTKVARPRGRDLCRFKRLRLNDKMQHPSKTEIKAGERMRT